MDGSTATSTFLIVSASPAIVPRSESGDNGDNVDDGPWAPLRIRVYRWLWIAGLVSNVGTFMHLVAAGWTMTTLSTSPTLVGLVQAAWTVPGFLLALHAGAFADLFDRRRLIVATQLVALGVAAALGVVQLAGAMSVGLLLAGTFVESVALTAAAPAFMAMTPELVGARHLPQAIGLDSISRNAAQAIGPAIAGGVIAATGPGGVFLLNAASFVGVVAVVRAYRPPSPHDRSAGAIGAAIRSGVLHVVSRRSLRFPVVRLALVSSTGAVLAALLPLVARERLHVGAAGFGALTAGMGVGAVVAVWLLTRIRSPERPELAALVATVLWSLGTVTLALSTAWWLGVIAVVLAGAGSMGSLSVLFANYTLQLDPGVRGRGSSLSMLMVWLGATLGAVAAGVVASAIGVRDTLIGAALVSLVVMIGARWSMPLTVPALAMEPARRTDAA